MFSLTLSEFSTLLKHKINLDEFCDVIFVKAIVVAKKMSKIIISKDL